MICYIAIWIKNNKKKDNESEFCEIYMGVPQGTVLGQLSLNPHINDLFKKISNESILSCADNTVLIATEKTW